MHAAETKNGFTVRRTFPARPTGFTLIEILMAMFIMALGVVGVMSLFPIGLESTRIAMDTTMADIIGRTGVAMMQCYMNASEIYDTGVGIPGVNNTTPHFRNPSRSCTIDEVFYPGRLRFYSLDHTTYVPSVTGSHNIEGFYLRFVKGEAAGQIRRIASASQKDLTIDATYPAPMNELPPNLNRNSSKLIVTRYGFPTQWKPTRIGVVRNVQAGAVIPGDVLDHDLNGDPSIPWGGSEWDGGSYYILFTGGRARGRLLQITGGGSNLLSIRTGAINLEDDGVQAGDTFAVLGCEDVRPCTFPPNFGGVRFDLRFETPPIIPYYTAPVPVEVKQGNAGGTDFSMPAEYAFACIISTVDSPPPVFPDVGGAKTARVDVIIYRNYGRDSNDPKTWESLEQQARAVGFYTGFVSPL
ncbi:MAG: prepilin-type N-terminal cleavage/methylation domain-containing protein [Planctomycetota bacterium]